MSIRVKHIIGLVAVIALTVACDSRTADTTVDQEPVLQRVIGFETTLSDGETRAVGDGESLLDNAMLKDEGFGVYCWYTGTSSYVPASNNIISVTQYLLMRNQKVEWKKWDGEDKPASWNYIPSKYWPLVDTEKLTFRAYAPFFDGGLQEDANGMPHLPVVVAATDYHNGRQHDPLWGTARSEESEKYGLHYDNYTWAMSDKGTIHWYFHHGMAKILFRGILDDEAPDVDVVIKSVKIGPLYTEGLLDLSSSAQSAGNYPDWSDYNPPVNDMEVELTLNEAIPSSSDLLNVVLTKSTSQALLSKGLLIIPRDYSSSNMLLTVVYEMNEVEHTVTADVSRVFHGNTAYTFDLNINPSNPSMKVMISVNKNWQTGSYFRIDI